jgi:hypothetical protein
MERRDARLAVRAEIAGIIASMRRNGLAMVLFGLLQRQGQEDIQILLQAFLFECDVDD